MLYLYGSEEINYIFHPGNEIEGIVSRAVATYNRRPGFFTPYRAVSECVGELLAPVFYPVQGVLVSCTSALSIPIVLVGSLVNLLIAFGAKAFGNTNLSTYFFEKSAEFLYGAGKLLLTSVVSALLAALSIPHSIASIITRSGASIAWVTTGYTDFYQEEESECDRIDSMPVGAP